MNNQKFIIEKLLEITSTLTIIIGKLLDLVRKLDEYLYNFKICNDLLKQINKEYNYNVNLFNLKDYEEKLNSLLTVIKSYGLDVLDMFENIKECDE
ncbi:MAG TPA: hypothetical protein PK762_12005 [Candidatus Kapabacteria bacterium]|nr:hypothetical protein [Candidatus Kapabacteria bacterium]